QGYIPDEKTALSPRRVGVFFAAGPLPRQKAPPRGAASGCKPAQCGGIFAAGPLPRQKASPRGAASGCKPAQGGGNFYGNANMSSTVEDLVAQAEAAFAQVQSPAALEDAKAKFLGKQGALTVLLKGLGQMTPEQKREQGGRINQAKQQIEALLNARR